MSKLTPLLQLHNVVLLGKRVHHKEWVRRRQSSFIRTSPCPLDLLGTLSMTIYLSQLLELRMSAESDSCGMTSCQTNPSFAKLPNHYNVPYFTEIFYLDPQENVYGQLTSRAECDTKEMKKYPK